MLKTPSVTDFPLHKAAAAGNIEEVVRLLESMDVNARDQYQLTPLHHAARSGKTDVMAILVSKGADIHALNQNNNTPLHSAAYGNQASAIDWLLAQHADKFKKNKDGDTPLHSAAWKGSVLSIRVLVDAACIDESNNEGDTPLHLAAWNKQEDAVKALIECNANIYAKNNAGEVPASLAEKKGHTSILELLSTQEVSSFRY